MCYCVAKAREVHTVAERVKQCITDVVGTMSGEKFSNILRNLPLSNDAVSRRIREMSTGIENEVTS
jgi:hypothetical protein